MPAGCAADNAAWPLTTVCVAKLAFFSVVAPLTDGLTLFFAVTS